MSGYLRASAGHRSEIKSGTKVRDESPGRKSWTNDARSCRQTFGRVNVPGAGAQWLAPPSVTACACVSSTCACVSSGSRPCGRGYLAVWPLVSGRVASGLSPRGVSSFVHARLGIRGNQGRMVSNLPSLCPHTCSRPPVVPHVPSPRRVEIAFLAGFVVLSLYWRCRATSHGG